jgi:hypothetical protein
MWAVDSRCATQTIVYIRLFSLAKSLRQVLQI